MDEENLHYLDNKRFAFLDNKGSLIFNHPNSSLAIIIFLTPKELLKVEELNAISQGSCIISNDIGIAVSNTEIPFTSTAITTRSSCRVRPRESKAQLALKSQE